MQNAPSRNAPCPCGSGKKYKRCCGQGHAAQASGTPATDTLQQVIRLYQQGNFQAAGQRAEQLLQHQPNDVTALEISAASALQLGNPGRAVERFKQQARLQPDNALTQSNLCMALHTIGSDEEAFLYGQQAIKLDPGLADAWNNLGNIYKSGNHLQGALEHYEKALALDGSDPRVHVNAGSASQLLGDLETAERRYQDALTRYPDFAPAHNNLGTVLLKQRQFDAAERHYQKALKLQPGNPETLTNLSSLWLEQGDIQKAQDCLEQVTRNFPEYVGAWINLGYLHEKRHDRDAAEPCYARALQLDPDNSSVQCNIAYRLFELGEQKEAVDHFIRALKSDPNSAKSLAGLGRAMLRQDEADKAAEYIGQALKLSPWDVYSHLARAQLAADTRDYDSAGDEWRQAIELQPQMSEGYIGLAKLYADMNRHEEARNVFLQAEQASAVSMNLYHSWSGMEEKSNRLDEAERIAGKAVEIDPSYPGLIILRAKLARRRGNYEGALELLKRIDSNAILSKQIKAGYLFELGAVNDKLGHYAAAFTAYDAANQAKNAYIGKVYEPQEDEEKLNSWKEFFTSENWRALHPLSAATGETRPCPVFIVGFPRSGTSLLEQILGSHPQIAPAGELTFIHDLAASEGDDIIGSQLSYPQTLRDPEAPLDHAKLQAMREFYLDGVKSLGISGQETRWITDKMPHNVLHLGLISLIFPESPIIHISRHPFNSCLSAYFSNFKSSHRYTSSLESTAQHYKRVMEMLDHYRGVLDMKFLEIHYEELVENQEPVTRQILDFIGAPWDDACLQHHKSKRLVRTASYEQVTRKVYRSSLYRYRNYRDEVQAIAPILEATLSRFGYSAD
jgi:tetratricopeptide (TPR) repeat protein